MSSNKSAIGVSVLAFLFALSCSQISIVESVDGRLFFLAYMNLTSSSPNPANGQQQIFISSVNSPGLVRITYQPSNNSILISLNSTNNYQYTLLIWQDLAGPLGTQLPPSVIIASQMDISVQTNKAENALSGGYLALPITAFSTNFWLASYTPQNRNSLISIAAPYDTCVDIRFVNGSNVNYRVQYLTLPPGTVYHLSSATDYTGMYVSATQPIAVYGGVDCAYVPFDESNVKSCDHIIEQIPYLDTKSIAQQYILSTFDSALRSESAGFQYRIVAQRLTTCTITVYNGKTQTLVGSASQPISAGNYYEGNAGRNDLYPTIVLIDCTAPVLVMQYNPAFEVSPETMKPNEYMLTIPPISHYTNAITFATSQYYTASTNSTADFANGITIVANWTALQSTIYLDGVQILNAPNQYDMQIISTAPANFVGYAVIYLLINPGFHTVTCTDPTQTYMVYVYGSAPASAAAPAGYGYLAGFRYPYAQNGDTPITTGPWFNFNPPVAVAVVNATPNATAPVLAPIQPADIPSYSTIWQARFYTLFPDMPQLITRNCSEAYYKYYIEQRFQPMVINVANFVQSSCAPGIQVNMTQLLYYSEYTDGLIQFQITVTGGSTGTLSNIFNCNSQVASYVSQFRNWNPMYQTITDFLEINVNYLQGCAVLYMNPPQFTCNVYGWICPTMGGSITSGATVARDNTVSLSLALLSSMVIAVFKLLR